MTATTPELSRRIDIVASDYLVRRYSGPGNPMATQLLDGFLDGAPAGAAVLSIHGDIGYLAAGSVLPQFRGRGLHASSIAARMDCCRTRHCRLVSVGAAWGTRSQRNLQRAGFAMAHVKSIWANGPRSGGRT